MGAPWKDLGQKADSEMWVRKMKCGGWTGDGSVGLKLRTQGGCGWDPGVAVAGLWMEKTAGASGTLEAEFFYCVIEYEI